MTRGPSDSALPRTSQWGGRKGARGAGGEGVGRRLWPGPPRSKLRYSNAVEIGGMEMGWGFTVGFPRGHLGWVWLQGSPVPNA